MFGLTPAHLVIILVIALIVVGPGKLPEVGSAIGKSIKEFQKAVGPTQDALTSPMTQAAPPAQVPAPVYYAVQPGYPAPAAPVQYQPVVGVIEPAPAQPAPIAAAAPEATQPVVQPAPASTKAD
jgi:TatA/E family protein of Tat protein translocase